MSLQSLNVVVVTEAEATSESVVLECLVHCAVVAVVTVVVSGRAVARGHFCCFGFLVARAGLIDQRLRTDSQTNLVARAGLIGQRRRTVSDGQTDKSIECHH